MMVHASWRRGLLQKHRILGVGGELSRQPIIITISLLMESGGGGEGERGSDRERFITAKDNMACIHTVLMFHLYYFFIVLGEWRMCCSDFPLETQSMHMFCAGHGLHTVSVCGMILGDLLTNCWPWLHTTNMNENVAQTLKKVFQTWFSVWIINHWAQVFNVILFYWYILHSYYQCPVTCWQCFPSHTVVSIRWLLRWEYSHALERLKIHKPWGVVQIVIWILWYGLYSGYGLYSEYITLYTC